MLSMVILACFDCLSDEEMVDCERIDDDVCVLCSRWLPSTFLPASCNNIIPIMVFRPPVVHRAMMHPTEESDVFISDERILCDQLKKTRALLGSGVNTFYFASDRKWWR